MKQIMMISFPPKISLPLDARRILAPPLPPVGKAANNAKTERLRRRRGSLPPSSPNRGLMRWKNKYKDTRFSFAVKYLDIAPVRVALFSPILIFMKAIYSGL
jgi:hypothetical protein